nr:reverse transcriptase domain-containing protein [Tanacetum cinerariifolium]
RSFLRMTKAITDFGVGTVTIYPDIDPFLEETKEKEKRDDDWNHLLDFNIDDVPLLGEEGLPPFICKMGKSSRNKKRAMENLNFLYLDVGTSSSVGVKRIKGEALKEKDDSRAFIFPIRLEGHVNKNALADTGSDINSMPYRIYETLGREDMKKVDRRITMINHTQAEAIGILTNVLYQVGVTTLIVKFLILDILIDHDSPIITIETHDDEAGSSGSKRPRQHETMEDVFLPQVHHEFLLWLCEAGSDEEIFTFVAWIRAFNINEPIYVELCHEFYSTYEFDEVCVDDELQTKKIIKFRLSGCAHSLPLLEFAQRLGLYQAVDLEEEGLMSTLKEPGVPRVGIPRPPRASMQDFYDVMGMMEIHQETIDRMEYRQSYHWDRYQGVIEHMAGVYSVPLLGAYNPPRLVPHLITPKNKRIEMYIYGLALQIRVMVAATEPTTIHSVVLKARMLTDEAIRIGSLKKNTKKRVYVGELSRNENVRDDNKRPRTSREFATITKPVRKEYTGTTPKCKLQLSP